MVWFCSDFGFCWCKSHAMMATDLVKLELATPPESCGILCGHVNTFRHMIMLT